MSDRELSSMDDLLTEVYREPEPDDEVRAQAAAVAAFNRIEAERLSLVRAERRHTRLRALILLGGWIGALALIVRGLVGWPAIVPAVSEAPSIPIVDSAADALAVSPWHLAAGLVLLAITAVFSIRTGLSES